MFVHLHYLYCVTFIESGRYNPAALGTKMKKVFITDGTKIPLTGRAIIIYRVVTTKAIEMRNVIDVNLPLKYNFLNNYKHS